MNIERYIIVGLSVTILVLSLQYYFLNSRYNTQLKTNASLNSSNHQLLLSIKNQNKIIDRLKIDNQAIKDKLLEYKYNLLQLTQDREKRLNKIEKESLKTKEPACEYLFKAAEDSVYEFVKVASLALRSYL